MPSGKKYFLARVSLPGLKELSLEPLWMINGRVQLNSKQKWVTVTIQDPALEPCFLDPQSQHLFSQPKRNWCEEFLDLAKEGLTGHDPDEEDSDESDGSKDSDPCNDGDHGDNRHSNNRKREEPRAEYQDDSGRSTQKRKMCTHDNASDTEGPDKKRKTLLAGPHVSLSSEPNKLGERGAKKQCNTPIVLDTKFNRGPRTMMNSRQRLHGKAGTKSVHIKQLRSRGLYLNNPNPSSLHREERARSPPLSAAVTEERLCKPDSVSAAMPSMRIENPRAPLSSQGLQNPVSQWATPEALKRLGCELM
ncbi:hypothetical protein DPEC_G00364720 [Dallia pectoralis]|nr:hypothetical protein DPEC_G00364720 [Dallia pectoralis]